MKEATFFIVGKNALKYLNGLDTSSIDKTKIDNMFDVPTESIGQKTYIRTILKSK